MNCKNCQKSVQENFKFCPYCGAGVNVSSHCPTCKNEVKSNWNACPNCGTLLNQQNVNVAQPVYQQPNMYPKHGYGRSNSSENFNGSGSHKRKRKGLLGHLFSS